MHDKLYMHLLKAKHQAERDRLEVKQKLDLFRKANRNVKLTKAIGSEYKQFEKQINQFNGLIRSLKQKLRNG
jgi:ferritin-like metal-binding protein YciE|tara:strand:- start:316 stop:531 length:216 start_codon:yes stop_codon:yes gene_type:complete